MAAQREMVGAECSLLLICPIPVSPCLSQLLCGAGSDGSYNRS